MYVCLCVAYLLRNGWTDVTEFFWSGEVGEIEIDVSIAFEALSDIEIYNLK